MVTHPAVIKLQEHIDLTSTCGYITLLNSNKISEGADASCNIAEVCVITYLYLILISQNVCLLHM